MKNLIIVSIALCFVLSSCENLLVKNLELEEFNYEREIAISGILASEEDEFRLLISENQAITDPFDQWEPLVDAEASLYKGETLVGELNYQEEATLENQVNGVFVLDIENEDISPGEYRIEVSHPELGTAMATSEVPQDVVLDEIVFEPDFGIAPNFLERSDGLIITFNDPPEDNYYSLSIESAAVKFDTFIFNMDTMIFENRPYISIDTNEPNAQLSGDLVLLTDDFFNGENHTITLYVTDFSEEGLEAIKDDLEIKWEVISKDKYEFDSSIELYYNSQGLGPFSEAVSIFNNIEGGVGIFGCLNRTFYKIP